MKAKDYAASFERGILHAEDPNKLLLLIFRDMVREANLKVQKSQFTTIGPISEVFEEQAEKWNEMCDLLPKYPLLKDGFKMLFKKKAPESYFRMILFNLKPLPEDSEAIDKIKAEEGNLSNVERNALELKFKKVEKDNGIRRSGSKI